MHTGRQTHRAKQRQIKTNRDRRRRTETDRPTDPCIYVYRQLTLHVQTYMCTYIYRYMLIYMWVCIYLYVYQQIYVYMHVHTCLQKDRQAYQPEYANTHRSGEFLCMFVYIHIHTTSPWLRRPAPGGHNRSLRLSRSLPLSFSIF